MVITHKNMYIIIMIINVVNVLKYIFAVNVIMVILSNENENENLKFLPIIDNGRKS
jgi:hypothetical protein